MVRGPFPVGAATGVAFRSGGERLIFWSFSSQPDIVGEFKQHVPDKVVTRRRPKTIFPGA
jgi:hypothetical protein